MGSVNKVILVGNLGRDAELRYTPGGAAVATINMATTDVYKDREGQKKEDTQWHRVVLWGRTAESLHEYLTKGKQIYVEGRLQTRKWTDKDGVEKYTTEIRGDEMKMLGSRQGAGGGDASGRQYDAGGYDAPAPSRPAPQQAPKALPKSSGSGGFGDFDDDIPF